VCGKIHLLNKMSQAVVPVCCVGFSSSVPEIRILSDTYCEGENCFVVLLIFLHNEIAK